MRNVNVIMTTILICCTANSFAQGRVVRGRKGEKIAVSPIAKSSVEWCNEGDSLYNLKEYVRAFHSYQQASDLAEAQYKIGHST